MSEIVQILVLCITVGLFVSWVLALKRQLGAAKDEVLRLRHVVTEMAEQKAAEEQVAQAKKSATVAAGNHAKLLMVGNVK